MDSERFDRLATAIAAFTSRRSVLGGLAAGGAGALLGLAGAGGIENADAKKKKKKHGKKNGKNGCKKKGCQQPDNPCQQAVCRGEKCRTEDKDDGTACGDGQVCAGGECACPSGEKFCENTCIPEGDPCFARVTPSDLNGWLLFGEDDFSNNSQLTEIVSGPDPVPAPGDGSVKLDPTAFDVFNEDQTQAVVRTLQYAGTKVSDIERLEYSVFVPVTDGDPPTMQLAVTGNFNGGQFASLVFIPGQNGNLVPLGDTWVEYSPSDEGAWVVTRDILGPANECLVCNTFGRPHEGDCTTPANCTPNETKTWAQIQSIIPSAELNGANDGDGGFSFRIGRGDTGTGHVTNVVFNDDGYFFEED